MPTKSKYARILARGSSEHITMVGCISAGGTAIPPLIVFSGTLGPPVALQSLESSFTHRKKKKYNTMFEKGENGSTEPVYTTWRYLKKKVENPDAYIVNPTDTSNHPLVKLGVIDESIAEVFTCPADDAGHLTKMRKMPKPRVLTSSDIASEIRKSDEKKKAADAAKMLRARKMLKNENEQPDSKRSKSNLDNLQEQLSTIETFQDFKEACVIALQKDCEKKRKDQPSC